MSNKNEYEKPTWLGQIDRIIFNLIRPVFDLSFSIDSKFPFNPSHFDETDDIELTSWGVDGGSVFLYELQGGTTQFRIHDINEQYAILNLNPHMFQEIKDLFDISKIVKFDMKSSNVISFISPELFQPIKDNLTEIGFDDCYLTELPKGIFKNLHLKLLSIFNCSLGRLSEDFALDGVGSVETLVLYDNVYANNIDIRPQLKVLEKEGTDIVFKSPLDPRDKAIDEKINQIFSDE